MLVEPELHLDADVLVPDIAAWRWDRRPTNLDADCRVAPDWVCEIVSPSTGQLDRVRKMPKYAANTVSHLWVIDPIPRTLEAYRLEKSSWLLLRTYGDDVPDDFDAPLPEDVLQDFEQ